MRVFLAGASGVIGLQLIPLLVADGHVVTGMTRSPEKAERVLELGAEPVVCDVYDASRLSQAVVEAAPELVMHQLTDLPDRVDEIPAYAERNNRIRGEGTANLLAAREAAGAPRFLAQSIAWRPPAGGEAVDEHERMVVAAGGVIVAYGTFYGPGTFGGEKLPPPPRIHVAEAARRTLPLMDADPGVYRVLEED